MERHYDIIIIGAGLAGSPSEERVAVARCGSLLHDVVRGGGRNCTRPTCGLD
jgi:pyruvate/2-oxoglutarate dehydrogenase complex dihydrolipoamide dehydrogenase (E3) component